MNKQINKGIKKVKRNRTVLMLSATFLSLFIAGSALFYVVEIRPQGLTLWQGYRNVASASIRYVKIEPGMRREEIVQRIGKAFNWTEAQKKEFVTIHAASNNNQDEGYYFPGTYLLPVKATPAEVSKKIKDRFNERIIARQAKLGSSVINLDTAIKIASIIQREAGGKHDMKIISGVIWNRIFSGMTLDMDATLQYAKATEKKWWPAVRPEDKEIDSYYNTYKYRGLPPTAISNPSEDAIWAALNPAQTKSIFYIHDNSGQIHTARTYQEHLANISKYFWGN